MPKNGEALDRTAVLDLALELIERFAADPTERELDRFLDRYAAGDTRLRNAVRTAVRTTLELRRGRGPAS